MGSALQDEFPAADIAPAAPAGFAEAEGSRPVPLRPGLTWLHPVLDHGFLWAAALVWLAPSVLMLARLQWSTEQGAYGPVILVTGLGMLVVLHRRHRLLARRGRTGLAAVIMAVAGLVHAFAWAAGILALLVATAWVGLVALLYGYWGRALMRRLWFPLLYLLFLIPPPYAIMGPLTRGLKLWVAATAVHLVGAAGVETAVSGDAVFVDQYELLVEAACSGMNSIVGLAAVGLFYLYGRHQDDVARLGTVAVLIVPIAMLANLLRVATLLWLVHAFGDAILGTLLHPVVGIAMFVAAMAMLAAADALVGTLGPSRRA